MYDSWINYYCKTLFITRCEIIGTKLSDMIAHQSQKLLYVPNQHLSIRNIMIVENAILIYFILIWYLIGKILWKVLIAISISMHNIYSIHSNALHWFVFSGEKRIVCIWLLQIITQNVQIFIIYTAFAQFCMYYAYKWNILHTLCIQIKNTQIQNWLYYFWNFIIQFQSHN